MEPISFPSNLSKEAMAVWNGVAESLLLGDIDKLTKSIQEFINLSIIDKRSIEDLATTLPYPGLPPQLITEILSNPEETVGIIQRLGSESNEEALVAELGTSEQALVLNALIRWLKSEQHISHEIAKATASQNGSSNDTSSTTTVPTNLPTMAGAIATGAIATGTKNPLNIALQNFIANGALASGPLDMSSLQFLKSNAISLAGLQVADPALLNKAYEIASQQLLINLLPDLNTSNAEGTSTEAKANVIQRGLVDSIRKALQDSAIPLNMQTFLVLWTLITLPAIKEPIAQAPGSQQQPALSGTSQIAAKVNEQESIGALTANLQGIASATGTLPASPIVASVLASLPSLFVGQDMQQNTLPTVVDQLGMLSFVYTQMAPYWSGPAAVSLITQKGVEVSSEQAKTESAVRAFAIALGALLNDPTFDIILANLISNKIANISQEQLKSFISAMKISILMNALVALNIVLLRKMQGQFRADELAQLILGPTLEEKADIDDLQSGLIKSIQVELQNIPEPKRASLIYNLLSTYSGNMDVNALIDPTKQFLNLLDPSLNFNKTSQTSA